MSTEEKVEMEAVPLKSDTDTPVGTDAEAPTAPADSVTVTQKKQFFHFLKKVCSFFKHENRDKWSFPPLRIRSTMKP